MCMRQWTVPCGRVGPQASRLKKRVICEKTVKTRPFSRNAWKQQGVAGNLCCTQQQVQCSRCRDVTAQGGATPHRKRLRPISPLPVSNEVSALLLSTLMASLPP